MERGGVRGGGGAGGGGGGVRGGGSGVCVCVCVCVWGGVDGVMEKASWPLPPTPHHPPPTRRKSHTRYHLLA